MKFKFWMQVTAAMAMVFVACGNDCPSKKAADEFVAVLDGGQKLSKQTCDESNHGENLFVTDSSLIFTCNGRAWVANHCLDVKSVHLIYNVDSEESIDVAPNLNGKPICGAQPYNPDDHEFACENGHLQAWMTDGRDLQKYRIVKIGSQVWMAENLNYKTGDTLEYETPYGRHYCWNTAIKVCPVGWHLPDTAEWKALAHFVDLYNGPEKSGVSLKSTTGWKEFAEMSRKRVADGTDLFGFNAYPSGASGDVGFYSVFWSSTEISEMDAFSRSLFFSEDKFSQDGGYKYASYSVRCIRNE